MKKLLTWFLGRTQPHRPACEAGHGAEAAMRIAGDAIVKAQKASIDSPDGPPEYWEVGELARLVSGGPVMTVTKLGYGVIECGWFHGTKHKREWFPIDAIEDAE